ncbi:peptidylprolyl isomerase [Wukongibacter baidiensis]|uniref:peptidylprolyl isomerase n=1 Tax=Wukongibacter baidiensis TaxID=1723361 RepID=UPI003D7F7E48
MKKIIVGLVILLLISTGTAFTAPISQQIEVLFNSINIEVNGSQVEADNILHNGTTYVPLRKVAELLNKEVAWNAETNTAQINDKNANLHNPIVTIEMESGEKIKVELYPDVAPNTVNNFISLINKKFYDGLTFHRVIPGFMIQGGDPNGNGTGGPGYGIKGEFMQNGVENNLMHKRGVISMARSSAPDSAGSQFFIMVKDSPFLNGEYAAFGKVIEGMEAVDKIVGTERDERDKPLKAQAIKTVSVELFGKEYKDPEIIK